LAEVLVQVRKRAELPIAARLQIIYPNLDGLAEGLEAGAILGSAGFQQAQPFAQDLAGGLIETGLHELLDQFGLMIGENDVPCGHGLAPRWYWHIMPMLSPGKAPATVYCR